jgi:hypothetical protein
LLLDVDVRVFCGFFFGSPPSRCSDAALEHRDAVGHGARVSGGDRALLRDDRAQRRELVDPLARLPAVELLALAGLLCALPMGASRVDRLRLVTRRLVA